MQFRVKPVLHCGSVLEILDMVILGLKYILYHMYTKSKYAWILNSITIKRPEISIQARR